ncbi:MAG TPA: flagellar biosynthetic protein FliR [Defluviitoga tunisiensis]|nr:flagellar biosynthetic protein FliR [Defluviitoga tunisiensis]HOB55561.1 flagellar biosynthetic protein FliR [Defluviitoga tunisiensis]
MILETLSYSMWIYFFIFFRLIGIVLFIPLFSSQFLPVHTKVFISLFISYLILPSVNDTMPLNSSVGSIVYYMILNFLIGITIGFITNILFYAVQFAGETIGMQMGFSVANVFDPLSNDEISILSEFSFLFSVLFFFIIKGPLILYTLVIDSFNKIPVIFNLNFENYSLFSQKLFDVIIIGVKLSMPVIAFMILIKVALGIVSRLIPQVNVFMVGIPIEILVGFLLFLGVIMIWEDQFTTLFFQLIEWIKKSMILLSR